MVTSVATGRTSESRRLRCRVNGEPVERVVAANLLLVDFLRDDLGLTGTKRSCDVQVCGTCTVLVDGAPVSACTYLAFEADEREVETVEGLADGEELHPIQQAFLDESALQCGYCTPGMIMTARALLEEDAAPDAEHVRSYMNGNVCRCTGYKPIVAAVLNAAARMRDE